jgi:hypothetical protein
VDEPSTTLRKQVNDFLQSNYNNETFMIELMGSIMEYNDAIQKDIHKDLSNHEVFDDNASNCIQKGIGDSLKKMLAEDDFQGYLNLSKERGFSCGNVEIAALSLIYQIPIEVIFKYKEEGQNARIFNLSQSERPPIKLAHRGYHFQLLLTQ